MKKYLTQTLFVAALAVSLSLNGCILDALNTLTQNIPISQEFHINSSQTSYSRSETIDLSNSSTYQSYADKIEQINFVRAEYRTKVDSVIPADLSGNITVTLKDNTGKVLFTYPLGQVNPADYINTPYELDLNSTEIEAINTYLSTLTNKVFTATISITNISPTPYTLVGVIDIVFEMKAKTS